MDAIYKKLYFDMLRIRLVEERIAERYPEKKMRCPVHLSIGQEAPAVGVCSAIDHADQVLSAHRAHAHYLAKGGDLKAMLAELYGKVSGCAMGKGGSMHLIDLEAGLFAAVPIVGSTIPIGVGVAWGFMQQNKSNIVVIFFGDGATEEGVFHESIDFASLKDLPVLFVCENNMYSVYSPLEVRQSPNRVIADIARAHGLRTYQGDGNNVAEVYKLASESVEHIRSGGGPVLLELETFRWLEHCGPNWDDDVGYRKENELNDWMARCPLRQMEAMLLDEGELAQEDLKEYRQIISEEIDNAFTFAEESDFPDASLLWEHVYAE